MRRRGSRKRRAAVCALFAAGVVGVSVAAMAATMAAAPMAHAGSFHVVCGFSHRLQDDPIVHPGQAGLSHWHDFYGARSARAGSTYRSMLASRTTCRDRRDTAGYWHPRLRVNGRVVRGVATAYYSRGGKPTVRAYPRDLRVVAGNARAGAPQSRRVVYWQCTGRPRTRSRERSREGNVRSRVVPRCRSGQRLSVNVRFPDCWDGLRLDSADHASHLRYSRRGRCPDSHAVPLPELVLRVVFNVRPRGGANVQLASGRAWTMHADFWNTWDQRHLRNLVNECLNLEVQCGELRSARR